MGELDDAAAEAAAEAHWDTIAIFEQILERSPEDAEALHELLAACVAVGEKGRAATYGKRLAQLALRTGDAARIRAAHDLLAPHAGAGQALADAVGELAGALAAAPAPAATAPFPPPLAPPAGAAREGAAAGETKDIIALVSKILENMPDDRESLEVLATAYLKAGDGVQAARTLARLADVLIRDQDAEEAAAVYEKLEMLKQVAPDTAPAAARLARFLNRAPAEPEIEAGDAGAAAGAARQPPPSLAIDAARRRTVLADEMDLLWNLQQQGLITETQYASVVRDLTELTSSDTITTISALHGLSFRSFSGLDALLVQLAAKAAMPVISLGGFDLQPAVFRALPLDYLTFQGVIPFEKVGDETLVTLLNPFSERLRKEVAAALGCRCHFYLIPPADFDVALEVVKNRYAAESK